MNLVNPKGIMRMTRSTIIMMTTIVATAGGHEEQHAPLRMGSPGRWSAAGGVAGVSDGNIVIHAGAGDEAAALRPMN
ncbi:hypothetical protein GCM10027405_03030 [Arthrobacter alkaliphilus]|uniref:hypothetical protein n=1 Tax=Arthrobacter alkaliphilus TaxID=369936 RepID=UPI001F3E92DD|nr:hypothetical protein [Arthrobacter alkaliphilus]